MTMLDRMRQHRGWLKWSLAVVVLTFVLLYVPSFLKDPGAAGANDVVATVNGRAIKAQDFQTLYQQQVLSFRRRQRAGREQAWAADRRPGGAGAGEREDQQCGQRNGAGRTARTPGDFSYSHKRQARRHGAAQQVRKPMLPMS